jgi:phosphate transport system protein
VAIMRDQYQHQLDSVLNRLVDMTGAVRTALEQGTQALLEGDAVRAESVIDGDLAIDAARERIEDESFDILARQSPVAGDLRVLVATLRMVTDLERMGDLSVHVARVARRRYPARAVPPLLVPTIQAMAATADHMIQQAAAIIAGRDVAAAAALEDTDDQMDSLRRSMFEALLSDEWETTVGRVEPAIDVALLGRYYERIGDHAVSMARRLIFIVTGEHPLTV